MSLKLAKEKLIRRLEVNLVSHLGAPEVSEDWVNGYQQAMHDAEKFLAQLEIYEPYNNETI